MAFPGAIVVRCNTATQWNRGSIVAPKRTRKRCESAAIVQYCRRGVYPTNGRAHNSVVSEVVELGLRTLVQLGKQAQARRLKGKLTWEGDLDAMRIDK